MFSLLYNLLGTYLEYHSWSGILSNKYLTVLNFIGQNIKFTEIKAIGVIYTFWVTEYDSSIFSNTPLIVCL